MKRVGQLMQEAGFNPQGSDSVKEAFIKHLIKASTGVHVATPTEEKEIKNNPHHVRPIKATQLAFDFMNEIQPSGPKSKKASAF